jgi:diguanylate cyclase (GGDEF)-like protein
MENPERVPHQVEPGQAPPEDDYRRYFLPRDIEMASLGVGIGIAAILVLSYIDFIFFGLGPLFFLFFLGRVVFTVFSLAVIVRLRRTQRVALYDAAIFVWWLALFSIIVLVDCSRPRNYVQNQVLYVLGAFACYTVIPLPRWTRLIPALALSVSDILILVYLKDPLPGAGLQMTLVSTIIMHMMGILVSARMDTFRRQQYTAQLNEQQAIRRMEKLATTDSLTELANRRRFIDQLQAEYCRFKRTAKPFALLMVDLDHFKVINDEYGHLAGDEVLRQFSRIVNEHKRCQDSAGRLGGDEFGILLTETNEAGALPFVERLRQACAQIAVPGMTGSPVFSMSIGISTIRPGDDSVDALVQRTDEALYRAKSLGRDRCELAG